MQMLGVEDVEEAIMSFRADLAKSDILAWHKLGKRLRSVVALDEALIEHKLWHGQRDRVLELGPDGRVVRNRVDRHHTDIQVSKRIWVSANLALEQVRMVAHFSELHDKVHQVFHLLLILCKLEEVFGRYLLLDPGVKNALAVGHVTKKLDFFFRRYFLLHVALHASEHEWLEDGVQPLQLMFVELTLVHG